MLPLRLINPLIPKEANNLVLTKSWMTADGPKIPPFMSDLVWLTAWEG